MASYIHAVMEFPYPSGLPRDVSQNTWTFITEDEPITETNLADVISLLGIFYNEATTTSHNVAEMISPYVDRDAVGAKLYQLVDPAGSGPGNLLPFAGGTRQHIEIGDADTMVAAPLEISVCMSYGYSNIVNPARGRGRIYIGPLTGTSLEFSSDAPRVPSIWRGIITNAANALMVAQETLSVTWGLWSRADGLVVPVQGGYVDDEWDTQRRRGLESTTRDPFSSTTGSV